jgi:hypothetical protein
MNIDERRFESNVITTLHKSREGKLTFLADRQFKTTILAVTVDLISADRFFVRTVNFSDDVKIFITALLLIFNFLVIFYLFAKKRSYLKAKTEFISFDRSLHRIIQLDYDDTSSEDTILKNIKKWFSDGTRMFSMIIVFALVLSILALWYNSQPGSKQSGETKQSANWPCRYMEYEHQIENKQ